MKDCYIALSKKIIAHVQVFLHLIRFIRLNDIAMVVIVAIAFQIVSVSVVYADSGAIQKNNVITRTINAPIYFAAGVFDGVRSFLHTVSGGTIGGPAQAIDGKGIREKNRGTPITAEEGTTTPSVNINAAAGFTQSVQFDTGFTSGAGATINGLLRGQEIDLGGGKITAGNVVYGLASGDGIEVGGNAQRPTISSNLWKRENTVILTRDPALSLTVGSDLTVGSNLTVGANLITGLNLTIGTTTTGSRISSLGTSTTVYHTFATTTLARDLANAWSIANSATGTPIVSIDSRNAGLIGIGTAAPTAKLAIKNSQLGSVAFQISAADGQRANILEINDAANSSLLVLDAAGRLGIGTNSFNAALSVASTSYFGGTIIASSSVYLAANSGRVGIGTLDPKQTLSVKGTFDVTGDARFGTAPLLTTVTNCTGNSVLETDGDGRITCGQDDIGSGGSPPVVIPDKGEVQGSTVGFIPFYSGGRTVAGTATVFYDSASTRVGIGTTTPFSILSIATSSRPQFFLSDPSAGIDLKHWYASSTLGSLTFGTVADSLATSSITERVRITNTGLFGIGTTSPGSILSIQGAANFAVATSTIYTPLIIPVINATSTIATSTFANGIDASAGCFAIGGTCVAGGSAGTVNTGTANRLAYYQSTIAINSANFLTIDAANGLLGLGTTTPGSLLSVQAGNAQITGTTTTHALVATSTLFVGQSGNFFSVFQNGNIGVGTTSPADRFHVDTGTIRQTPTNPTYLGGSDNGGDDATQIVISGRYAYLSKVANAGTCSSSVNTGCELQIYDISNPTAPAYIGGASNGGDRSNSLFISGRYVYLTKNGNAGTCSSSVNTGCELQIYDISNPTAPAYIGGADHGGGTDLTTRIIVVGRYAYIGKGARAGACNSSTNTGCELQVYDIGDPTNPTFVGGADDGGSAAQGMTISGRYLYFTANTNAGTCSSSTNTGCELQIYDISHSTSTVPLYVGGVDNGGSNPSSIVVSGRYAYVTKSGNAGTCNSSTNTGCELQVYDISSPTAPVYVGGVDNGADVDNYGLSVFGRYLALTRAADGSACSVVTRSGCELQIYDIISSSTPTYLGGADVGGGDGNSVWVSGRYGYVVKAGTAGTCNSSTNTGCEVQVYDITGIEATSVLAHNLEAGSLQVRDSAFVNSQLTVTGDIAVGVGGILSQGQISATKNIIGYGLVGIGTTTPYAKLSINSGAVATTTLALRPFTSQTANIIDIYNTSGTLTSVLGANDRLGLGTTTPGSLLSVQAGNAQITGTTTAHALVATSTLFVGATGNLFNVMQSGNVGIGTTTPGSLLSVQAGNAQITGTTTAHGLIATSTLWVGATGNLFQVTQAGNVGIGTTSPATTLNIYNPNESATLTDFTQTVANAGLLITTDYTAGAYTPGIFWTMQNNVGTRPKAGIWLLEDNSGADMYFGTSNLFSTGITNNGLVIDQAGSVGVGQTSPETTLHVTSSDNTWGGVILENTSTVADATFSTLINARRVSTVGAGVGFAQDMQTADGSRAEYGYVGAIIESNTNSSQSGSLVFAPRLNNLRIEAMRITSVGRVGIGTSTPGSLLSVQAGNAQITGTTTTHALIATSTLFVGATGNLFNVMQSGNVGIGTTSPSARFAFTGDDVGSTRAFVLADSSNRERFTFLNSGVLGIGTTSPALLWAGTGTSTGNVASSSYLFALAGGAYLDSNIITISSSSAAHLTINYQSAATTTILNNALYSFTIATSTTADPILRFNTTANQRATTSILGGLSVDNGAFEYDSSSGITTADSIVTGTQLFDVNAGVISWIDLPVSTTNSGVVQSYTAHISDIPILTIYGVTTGGTANGISTTTVGIGTTTPAWLLSIASTSPFFSIMDTDAPNNQKNWTISNQTGNLYFATTSDSTYATSSGVRLTFSNRGNVGIGTTSPGTSLAVRGDTGILSEGPITVWDGATQRDIIGRNGALCVDNNGTTKCQATLTAGATYADSENIGASDVAENYPIADPSIEEGDIVMVASFISAHEQGKRDQDEKQLNESYKPGTVSEVIESLTGSVEKATKEGAHRIVGVISTKPGIVLGDTTGFVFGSSFKPVALAGRVPIKVSTENGPIAVGDRIMISSIPGFGAKAVTSGGTVGIALEAFDDNRATTTAVISGNTVKIGKILVFMNLGYAKLDAAVAHVDTQDLIGNPWSVDRSSGKIFSGNDLDLQGYTIANAASISSKLGTWSIDADGTIIAVKVITDEMITKKLAISESATFGSAQRPIGITIYDEVTKEPYCMKMHSGAVVSMAGVCEPSADNPLSTPTLAPTPSPSSSPEASPESLPDAIPSPSPSDLPELSPDITPVPSSESSPSSSPSPSESAAPLVEPSPTQE